MNLTFGSLARLRSCAQGIPNLLIRMTYGDSDEAAKAVVDVCVRTSGERTFSNAIRSDMDGGDERVFIYIETHRMNA